jgi:prenyltransferase beta subunit
VLRELLGRPESDSQVARARRDIGRVGWAHDILRQQLPDGQWDSPGTSARDLYLPKYIAANWRLLVLSDLGVSGDDPRVRKAVALFLKRYGGPYGGLGTRRGSEVCFTGNAVRMLVRFGRLDDPRVRRSIDWLVRSQKADGGWHCFPSRTGTLDCWEALAAFATIPRPARSPAVDRAIERGAEFYLSRGLLR